jgi:Homeodomain-like domain
MNGSSAWARTVISAVATARIGFVTGFCVAVCVVPGRRDTSEQDPAMVIAPDIEAQILRYHHAEKWPVGTIARQLHVHHSTVRRVLAQAGLPQTGPPPRPAQIDAYLPFIHQTLEMFPTLKASRLYAMVREPEYCGSRDHFRHLTACHRPRPKAQSD